MPALLDIARAALKELVLCAIALQDAHARLPSKLLALPPIVTEPMRAWKRLQARRHRAAAKRHIDELHMALHDHASMGVRNADLWSAIMRGVDALSLSRWLATDTLGAPDVLPSAASVDLIKRDLNEVIDLLNELEWPGERSPPSST